jgi:hypothetical protein
MACHWVEAFMIIDQSDWQPWRYRFVLAPAMIACVVVTGSSIYYYFQGSCGIGECMDHVPLLKEVALALVAVGMLAKGVERIFIWLRGSSHSD